MSVAEDCTLIFDEDGVCTGIKVHASVASYPDNIFIMANTLFKPSQPGGSHCLALTQNHKTRLLKPRHSFIQVGS